jgi:uncharacterized membrane protein
MTMSKNRRSFIRQPAKALFFVIAFFVACLIALKSLTYFLHPDLSHGFLSDKKDIFDPWYKYILYTHIFSAPLTIFTGILQFSLKRTSIIHKLSGYIYIPAVVLAACSGLVMSFYSVGGIISGISFFILSILWLLFTLKAFALIKAGKIEQHKAFMTRSFILANSAVLLRLFSFISNRYTTIDPVTAYTAISWLSWLPWLLIYEWSRRNFSLRTKEA